MTMREYDLLMKQLREVGSAHIYLLKSFTEYGAQSPACIRAYKALKHVDYIPAVIKLQWYSSAVYCEYGTKLSHPIYFDRYMAHYISMAPQTAQDVELLM
jgi:hypothetical protein